MLRMEEVENTELDSPWGGCGILSLFAFGTGYGCGAEKAMAPHSSTLAWKIPWTAAYQAPPSMELQRVGHD